MRRVPLLAIAVVMSLATVDSVRSEEGKGRRVPPGALTLLVTAGGKPTAGVVVHVGPRYAGTGLDGRAVLDGVPAGTWKLVVEELGFDRIERELQVGEGPRPVVEVPLAAVKPATVRGQIVLAGDGRGLAGAVVRVDPVSVAAQARGPFDFTTDFDGRFTLLSVPPGRYRAAVRADGCKAAGWDFDVAPGMADLAWELRGIYEEATLAVEVKDAATGKAVAGARVILAEAWPQGAMGTRDCDASGRAEFAGLQFGLLNWADGKGAVARARRHVSVRVEAEGYQPAVVPAALSQGSRVQVAVNPLAVVKEQEPNPQAQPQAILSGAPVEFRLNPVGDVDAFRLRVRNPALLRFETEPKGVLELWGRVLTADGRLMTERGCGLNDTLTMVAEAAPGEYRVEISEWGNNAASETPVYLRVTEIPAPDPFEPNETQETARAVRSGEELRGCTFPAGDQDWFRLEMKRPGHLRITRPAHVLETWIRVVDAQGRVRGETGAGSRQPLDLQVGLDAGTFGLQVQEWGNNGSSTEPWTIRVETWLDDGVDDPAPQQGRVAAVRTLALNSLAGATIDPVGDADRFAVPLPSAGVVKLRATGPTELWMRLIAADGKVLTEGGTGAGGTLALEWSATGPCTPVLELSEWGNNGWSPSPYSVWTAWVPCDETEALQRNESLRDASDADPGDILRGSMSPVGDQDFWRLTTPGPGRLTVQGSAPTELWVRLLGPTGQILNEGGVGDGQEGTWTANIPVGTCFVHVQEWGNNGAHSGDYALRTRFDRAEPAEREPLNTDPVRLIKPGEARSFFMDQVGDRDRFVFDIAEKGRFSVRLGAATEIWARLFDDRTGKMVWEGGTGAGWPKWDFEAAGPTRYRLEMEEWGNNGWSPEPSWVLVDGKGREIPAVRVGGVAEATDPLKVVFSRAEVKGAAAPKSVRVDADGDGKADFDLPAGGATFTYAAEGTYPAESWAESADGIVTRTTFWVSATGPREKKGVQLRVDDPREGATLESESRCRVRAVSYTGARVVSVSAALDGRAAASSHSAPFDLDVPWLAAGAGEHVLAVTAVDAKGESATVERRFRVSEYFDLQPADGAVVSGNEVRVSWRSAGWGKAAARFRPKGTEAWKEVLGERGRDRRVVLEGLEPGQVYEFQAIGDGEPSAVRTVTRVKGLAFGRGRYGATIARDYDQRLGISVRNHSDKAMTVRLECGKPAAESRLLVGFVGEGSEGRPFSLQPGEERDFLLGISAQDVLAPVHRFPVRISSESGFSDEAEVEVTVKLPVVKLEWQDLGAEKDGLGKKYRLWNRGDGLTDLKIGADRPGVAVEPAADHAMLPAGGAMDVLVRPVLGEGFTGTEAEIRAGAFDKSETRKFTCALPDGEKIHGVDLVCGAGTGGDLEAVMRARSLAGAWLDPGYVDWSRRESPQDTDGDGRPDRWTLDDRKEFIRWTGMDTDGDGEVDFVHGDVGLDGQVDYAGFRTAGGWERTNLVDAWLEMGFSLPWARDAYEKHDLDVVMNGRVVGRLRDTVPEGNYAFPIPASAIRFGDDGTPGDNSFELASEHLRGGHYVVSSDFNVRTRLTSSRVWAAGKTEEEARKRVLGTEGLSLAGPDWSVSSREIAGPAGGTARKGEVVSLSVPLRNLGAAGADRVEVALARALPGGTPVELARQVVEGPPLGGATVVTFPWTAAAGTHSLRIIADPDRATGDPDPGNNVAMITVTVPGDDAKPTIALEGITDGATLSGTALRARARASDDSGVARVEARVDGGLWTELEPGAEGFDVKGLLQPGAHRVDVRAVDGGGNIAEQGARVNVDAKLPEAAVEGLAAGQSFDTRTAPVAIRTGPDAALAGVRVNGGPWQKLPIRDGVAKGAVRLPYGNANVETMVADGQGAIRKSSTPVTCTAQPDGPEPPLGEPEQGIVDVPGLGAVDLFASPSQVVAPRRAPAPRNADAGTPDQPAAASAPPRPWSAGAPARPSASRQLAVRRRQQDWYCTNRPRIKVPFRLPAELMRKKLPKPGTREYEQAVKDMLDLLRRRGIDTKAFERFQESLRRRCRTLEGPEGIPGFLESIGFGGDKPKNEAELQAWRDRMAEGADAWWLRLLSSGDPDLIREGLRARGEALGHFDEALQHDAEAAITAIQANQKLVEDVASALPYVGDAMDLIALATGETLSGEKLDMLGYVLTGLGVFGPEILGKLAETKAGREALEALAEKGGHLADDLVERMAKALGKETDDIRRGLQNVSEFMTKERKLTLEAMENEAEYSRRIFANSEAGKDYIAKIAKDREEARKLVDAMRKADDPEEFKRLLMEWQSNKTAQSVIHDDVFPNDLRKRVNDALEKQYQQVDSGVARKLRDNDGVKSLAERHGLKPGEYDVAPLTITNTGKKGNPSKVTCGRDRDVTYVLGKTDANGNFVPIRDANGKAIMIDHSITEPVYAEAYWKNAKHTNTPGTPEEMRDFLRKNDQAVTDRFHPEAYNPGEVGLDDFLNKKITPTMTRLEDVRDTIRWKGDEWFEKAQHAIAKGDPVEAARHAGEGMRQTTKQWDNIIMTRVDQYKGLVNVEVPPRLQKGMEIFKKVESRQITVREAEAMLDALTPPGSAKRFTKEALVADAAAYFEALEKGPGAAFRKVKTSQVREALAAVPGRGGAEWGTQSLEKINDALRNGHVDGTTFMKMRDETTRALVSGATTPEAKKALREWARGAGNGKLLNNGEVEQILRALGPE
ncbi:MAG: carboxypeptidase regulatory-like domain-containing protein [Planctomycetia bacterium]|nr:carboxypeptidase regulatory-like domain-containing protein [Planctomycetia bacterium]